MQPTIDEVEKLAKQPLLSDPATQEYFLEKVGSLLGEVAPCPVNLSKALVSYPDLLALEIPERPRHLPWLFEGGNVLVYGPRGVGKTFFQLALATALTTGKDLWKWTCPAPVGVLYVDGEMQLDELRQRTTSLMDTPPVAPLEFLSGQLVFHRCGGKDLILTSEVMRQEVVNILDARPDIRILILDNISCLFSGIREDSKQDWEPINAWLIRLRHRGLATLLVHHAGKGGQQRGTSGREDSLDTVIHLDKPKGSDAREGCHFHLSFTKCRKRDGRGRRPAGCEALKPSMGGCNGSGNRWRCPSRSVRGNCLSTGCRAPRSWPKNSASIKATPHGF